MTQEEAVEKMNDMVKELADGGYNLKVKPTSFVLEVVKKELKK